MGQRAQARGVSAWKIVGTQFGPDGSGLRATFFIHEGGVADECADIEEAIGKASKRRLIRITGDNAHLRAVAWMDGYVAGRSAPPPPVEYARVKRKKTT
jgi:hypothetical protein